MLSTNKKTRAGLKGAKLAATNPALRRTVVRAARPPAKAGWGVGKAIAKRRARRRLQPVQDVARAIGETLVVLVTHGPQLAQELGLVEAPKPKRRAPAVAVGIVIGACAVYFFEPEHGPDHRRRAKKLLTSS